ncbi:MAG: PEP-CTERM sorting domain-containing protein [Acidobacteriia bacterium]|nr:PEP-CTERM sorting domain-containing protein [Terriglobia bacterium]
MKKLYLVVVVALLSVAASAGPIPPGWACNGACGTDGADGVVGLSPFGNPQYKWVSTFGGPGGVGQLPSVGGTNGSVLTTSTFSANAGDSLNFYFNYVTSDGAQFADYAWVQLIDTSNPAAALLLFSARTNQVAGGDTVPGFGLPPIAPGVTLVPPSTPIIPGAPFWSPLGPPYNGTCYDVGCGYTGWIQSLYTIPNAGNYQLAFGVTNWIDTAWDSGLAIDGVTVAGQPIPGEVPEPGTIMLFGTGLFGLAGAIRRKFAR